MTDNQKKTSRVSAAKTRTTVRLPLGMLEIFNQHDTPPPVLFMEGSCIMEFGYVETPDRAQITDLRTFKHFLTDTKQTSAGRNAGGFAVAHVKVVDGSGDALPI